jgi:uncharacterized membrane protein
MTLLGLATMAAYAVMLATGVVDLDVMPQFMILAVIFLSSGRLRMATRNLPQKETDEGAEERKKPIPETEWHWLSQFLNWAMALIILGVLALWVMKPIGVSLIDEIQEHIPNSKPYFSDFIP